MQVFVHFLFEEILIWKGNHDYMVGKGCLEGCRLKLVVIISYHV